MKFWRNLYTATDRSQKRFVDRTCSKTASTKGASIPARTSAGTQPALGRATGARGSGLWPEENFLRWEFHLQGGRKVDWLVLQMLKFEDGAPCRQSRPVARHAQLPDLSLWRPAQPAPGAPFYLASDESGQIPARSRPLNYAMPRASNWHGNGIGQDRRQNAKTIHRARVVRRSEHQVLRSSNSARCCCARRARAACPRVGVGKARHPGTSARRRRQEHGHGAAHIELHTSLRRLALPG